MSLLSSANTLLAGAMALSPSAEAKTKGVSQKSNNPMKKAGL